MTWANLFIKQSWLKTSEFSFKDMLREGLLLAPSYLGTANVEISKIHLNCFPEIWLLKYASIEGLMV